MLTTGSSRADTCVVRGLSALVATLRASAVDVDAILAVGGIQAADLDEPDRRMDVAGFRAIWQEARRVTGEAALGLRVVEHVDVERVTTLLVYLASASATGREAFERALPYMPGIHSRLSLELEENETETICHVCFRGWEQDRTLNEYLVGLIVKLAPFVVERDAVVEARFAHAAPDYADDYERVLGVEVTFAAATSCIVGRSHRIDDPLPRSDAILCRLLERQAESALARFPADADFAARVRGEVERQLKNGEVSADSVAEALGQSSRTLRRRLNEAGVSYQALLDNVRCERARRSLARPGASVAEVAFELGFSDPSAFHKAFRRWTGRRPSDWVARGGR